MANPTATVQNVCSGLSNVNVEDLAIIAVMGTTGSGKSTFIQKATEAQDVIIGHSYAACTQEPRLYELSLDGKAVALLDTPGFDDTYKTDAEVLQGVAEFLAFTYQKNMKLSGIIYLQRIIDPRMTHGGRANLELFRALCGDDPLRKVVLATTFWSEMKNLQRAVEHEEELKTNPDYWGGMLAKKATMTQFHDTRDSALSIIRGILLHEEKITLKIQREMVDQKLDLIQTTAGETLKRELSEMAQQYEKLVQKLQQEKEDALKARDFDLKEVKEEQARKSEKIRQTFQDQLDALKANNREELRARDMEFDARLRTMRKIQQETDIHPASSTANPTSNPSSQPSSRPQTPLQLTLISTSKPSTPTPTSSSLAFLPNTPPSDSSQSSPQNPTSNPTGTAIAAKGKSRIRREKYLRIFGAVGTTAAAAGLSVINPLAIPVAFAGLIGIINACFERKNAVETMRLDRQPETYGDIAAN